MSETATWQPSASIPNLLKRRRAIRKTKNRSKNHQDKPNKAHLFYRVGHSTIPYARARLPDAAHRLTPPSFLRRSAIKKSTQD